MDFLELRALDKEDKTYVFLYYTESPAGDASNSTLSSPSYNKLYRYELVNDKLLNPQLIFTGRTPNRYSHIGGAIEIGPDNHVYLTVGDLHGDQNARLQERWLRITTTEQCQMEELVYSGLLLTEIL